MINSTPPIKLLVIIGLWGGAAFGQQVVGTTGGSIVGSSYSLSYTVGEVATQTLSGGGYILNQGFQQPSYTITSIEDNLPDALLTAFPNPTTGLISIAMKDYQGKSLSYILYDFKGQEILRSDTKIGTDIKFDLDLTSFSQGIYLLKVMSGSQSIKVLKIVKN